MLLVPLADKVFEPLLAADGPLAGSIGKLVGIGPGRGIGLLFVVMGALHIFITVAGYLYPRLRLVEDELGFSKKIIIPESQAAERDLAQECAENARNQVISSGLGGLRALWAAYRCTVLGQLFFWNSLSGCDHK